MSQRRGKEIAIMGADNNNRKKSSAGRKVLVWRILLAVCLVGAAVAIGILIRGEMESRRQARLLAQLAEQMNQAKQDLDASDLGDGTDEPVDTPKPGRTWEELSLEEKNHELEEFFGIDIPDKAIDFANLQEVTNPHIYAWIYIPNSIVDYPVLRHPDNNSYYLNHNIDGTRGYPGCIYTEDYNSPSFTDHNTVLYGHNMKDGSMFGALHKFEDAEYFDENQYIYIYTPDEVFVYRIFRAYEYSDIHLLAGYDTTTEKGFGRYLEDIMSVRSMVNNVDEDVEVTSKDRIITLSTCCSKPGRRYLVQGLLLRVEEEAEGTYVAED